MLNLVYGRSTMEEFHKIKNEYLPLASNLTLVKIDYFKKSPNLVKASFEPVAGTGIIEMDKEILNFYEFVEDNQNFQQFRVDEILFTAYDCPLEESPLDYWTQKNYFCYIIKGGLKWKTPKEEYIVHVGDALFIQKGAHRVYKIDNGEFCALLIFMPDEFVKED